MFFKRRYSLQIGREYTEPVVAPVKGRLRFGSTPLDLGGFKSTSSTLFRPRSLESTHRSYFGIFGSWECQLVGIQGVGCIRIWV